jgi:hypothetical protein
MYELKKLYIIIPIRNRESNLNDLVFNLKMVLRNLDINYEIVVIDQSPKLQFNKGKLINIGVREILKTDPYAKYFVAHDVDIIPMDSNIIDYNYHTGVHHPYGNTHCLGGIVFFDKTSFLKVNGFSNDYFGWGSEDIDFQNRFELMKIPINRKSFIHRRTTSRLKDLPDKAEKNIIGKSNHDKMLRKKQEYHQNLKFMQNDGISSMNYAITQIIITPDYTRKIVDI